QTPDTISIKVEEDIGGGMPTVEDGDDFGARSTQRGATSESLHVDAPASHMSSPNGELTGHRGGRKGQPCDLFGKGFPDNTKMTIHMESLLVDAPGSSHISSHNEELRILVSTEKGRAHWQSTVMKPSSRVKLEALSSLSADRSVAKSLERSECAGSLMPPQGYYLGDDSSSCPGALRASTRPPVSFGPPEVCGYCA
ncbi:unnamed protein product, partial [Gadus morhua 'NCC']